MDRFGQIYHLISKLHCTEDMTLMPEKEAFESGATPCSSCFSKYYDNTGTLTIDDIK